MDYTLFEPNLKTWGPKMKKFIESPQCDEIYGYIKEQSSGGKVICPSWEDTFRAFSETPYEELKVIFFLQDPYPWSREGIKTADGVALSCRNTGICQPSLDLFYEGIVSDLPEYLGGRKNADLTYLCKQGVMMLNSSLTVEMNKPGSHSAIRQNDKRIRLWEPFMRFLLEDVLSSNSGLILVFAGKESQHYEKFVNPLQHYCLKVEHPASAAHQERQWKTEGLFKSINTILWNNNKVKIKWI